MRFRATYSYQSARFVPDETRPVMITEMESVDCEAGTWNEAYISAEEVIERELGEGIGGVSPVPYTVLSLELLV